MEKPKTTPKDFFLWAGTLISLYVSVVSLLALLFSYVNFAFPDPLEYGYYGDPYSSGVRSAMASLIVFFPLFLGLSYAIRRSITADATRRDVWVRRWALYLTVFLAGATIAIDLVALLNTFLAGEVTVRFALKAAFVLLVTAAGFMHFLADIWGYWIVKPSLARTMAVGVSVLVVVTIASGFVIIGSPVQARLISFDNQKIQTLQQVQSSIQFYWQQNNALPAQLSDVPQFPTSVSITYKRINARLFQLCTHFDTASPSYVSDYEWYHGVGDMCFVRSVASWYAGSHAEPAPKLRP